MYYRGAKVTFANELMKKSVLAFMTRETDGKNNMSMSFRADLSANSILLVQLFPSKKDSDAHDKAVNAMVTQIKEGGARVEQMEGEVSNFFISGNLTLDDLKGSS
jgi:hypothetical protein